MAKAPGIGTEITKKAFEYIDAIAANLGVATEYVLEILIRQQVAEGISQIAITLVLVTLVGFVVLYVHKATKGNRDEDVMFAKWAVTVIYLIISAMVIAFLQESILQIINPQYYAIKEILDALTGGN